MESIKNDEEVVLKELSKKYNEKEIIIKAMYREAKKEKYNLSNFIVFLEKFYN